MLATAQPHIGSDPPPRGCPNPVPAWHISHRLLHRNRPPPPPSQIEDDFKGYDLQQFMVPHHYQDDLASILIPHGLILNRLGPGPPACLS